MSQRALVPPTSFVTTNPHPKVLVQNRIEAAKFNSIFESTMFFCVFKFKVNRVFIQYQLQAQSGSNPLPWIGGFDQRKSMKNREKCVGGAAPSIDLHLFIYGTIFVVAGENVRTNLWLWQSD